MKYPRLVLFCSSARTWAMRLIASSISWARASARSRQLRHGDPVRMRSLVERVFLRSGQSLLRVECVACALPLRAQGQQCRHQTRGDRQPRDSCRRQTHDDLGIHERPPPPDPLIRMDDRSCRRIIPESAGP
ncbi:hypothetical protein Stsp02_51020 [Streptomyces sp. NBRC 14336]|nr:hypothetical protein Stsp02_51020 [Streptomyces sp. NBRC 14336]